MRISKILKSFSLKLMIILTVGFATLPNAIADWKHIPGQLTVEILQAPTPLLALGNYYLVYELHLTNYHTSPINLTSLVVRDTTNNALPFKFIDQDLAKLIYPIGGVSGSENNQLTLQPGISKMIFMWLPLKTEAAVFNQLIHEIKFNTQHKNEPITLTTTTDPLMLKKTNPPILRPPLQGDYWVAGAGPSNVSDHRIANMVVNGHDYFAQRYAIDFIQIGPQGISYSGDEHKNESYFCYGKNVLSVASGKVIAIKNDIPENIPNTETRAVSMELETVGGNYVIMDIGNGHFACYAHMIPGSITVKEGDRVTSGQVLGKIGNSGNATEPHLHFHVADKPSFIAANGIPYAFDNFSVRPSKLISQTPVFKIQVLDDSLEQKLKQLVLENTVIKF